jgi:hypothetical protein
VRNGDRKFGPIGVDPRKAAGGDRGGFKVGRLGSICAGS